MMPELAVRNVENGAILDSCPFGIVRQEHKHRVSIDEFLNEPRAGDSIYFNFLASDPFHTWLWLGFCFFAKRHPGSESSGSRLPSSVCFCCAHENRGSTYRHCRIQTLRSKRNIIRFDNNGFLLAVSP